MTVCKGAQVLKHTVKASSLNLSNDNELTAHLRLSLLPTYGVLCGKTN